MATQTEVPLLPGYKTIRQAASDLGVKPRALYMYLWNNGIECKRVGKTIVVREADLAGYMPRGSR